MTGDDLSISTGSNREVFVSKIKPMAPNEPPESALVRQVADSELSKFPQAMDHIVAAGFFTQGGELIFTCGSHFLVHGSEDDMELVHAEESAIGRYCRESGEGVDLVVTLEPCDTRSDDKLCCARRIVQLSDLVNLRRVVAGCYDDGNGVRILADHKIRVDLLVGEELNARRGIEARKIENLKKEVKRKGWANSGLVNIIETPVVDGVNAENDLRRTRMNDRVKDLTLQILKKWSECKAVEELAEGFPLVICERDIEDISQRIKDRNAQVGDTELILPLIRTRALGFFKTARDKAIRAEIVSPTRPAVEADGSA